jgi:pimeloyl-ACP methyl ester carboxylesterase
MTRLLLVAAGILATVAHGQEIVSLQARPGVTQSYLLVNTPQPPQAVAVLFPGGGGNIRLRAEGGQIRFGPNNFLVRARTEFVARGAVAAVMDAPSDQQNGMPDVFRMSEQHYTDVSAIVADLRKRFPGTPLFLVGTSRGTVSAAALGKRMGKSVDGVVLTSSLFLAGSGARGQAGLSGFDFASIEAPLLFVHHTQDGCGVTPYQAARRLADRYPLISVSGGLPPQSEPCEALSTHGYLGKESETVEAIVNWMLKKPYSSEIN